MKNRFKFLTFITLNLLAIEVWAKVAMVKLIRGEAVRIKEGKEIVLKLNDWLEEGVVVKTGEKSFVKLVFIDKSTMNVGARSEMKIASFSGQEAGVIDLVKGQIRSQVTKDYLQIKEQDKSKLFIKSPNAVMGIRGTDFMITTNGVNTATVLFEGEVVFNSLPDRASDIAKDKLDDHLNRGVRISPGEFSVVQGDLPQPTVPSTMNLKQREVLEKNVNLETPSDKSQASQSETPVKNIVPEGLSGEAVANASTSLKAEVAETVAAMTPKADNREPASTTEFINASQDPAPSDAAGYVEGDKVKPANGSFVHLESGTIVPPPPGSVLDPNTNTFIPAPGNGTVSADGNFVPPKGIEITPEGKIFVTVVIPESSSAPKVVEVAKIAPVVSSNSASLNTVAQVIISTPSLQVTSAPVQATQVIAAVAVVPPPSPVINLPEYTSPAQTTYTTAPPVEAQIINTATSGRLNIQVIK